MVMYMYVYENTLPGARALDFFSSVCIGLLQITLCVLCLRELPVV